jgi:hypothetical protein
MTHRPKSGAPPEEGGVGPGPTHAPGGRVLHDPYVASPGNRCFIWQPQGGLG